MDARKAAGASAGTSPAHHRQIDYVREVRCETHQAHDVSNLGGREPVDVVQDDDQWFGQCT